MKGGVGKTTITLNLAYALAHFHEKKVLVVDFDPQANASGGLLNYAEYERHRKEKKIISDIFSELELLVSPVKKNNEQAITLQEMAVPAREFTKGKIDLVLSELELSNVLERAGGSSLEDRLKILLRNGKKKYDFVLVDCGPTYSVLTNNALKASDFVLVPVKPDPFSARGIPLLLKKIELHNRAHEDDDKVQILGIVFSMVREGVEYATTVKGEILREHKNVFQSEIRYTEHYSRGLLDQKTIFEVNSQDPFKKNFEGFAAEVLSRLERGTKT